MKGRVADISPRTRKTSCELERDCKRFPDVVECGNLEGRKIEALAQHIDTDNDARFS